MNEKKWTKGDEFVEIQSVTAVAGGAAIVVKSNAFKEKGLPLDWRDQVLVEDAQAISTLFESVSAWAKENGYKE